MNANDFVSVPIYDWRAKRAQRGHSAPLAQPSTDRNQTTKTTVGSGQEAATGPEEDNYYLDGARVYDATAKTLLGFPEEAAPSERDINLVN